MKKINVKHILVLSKKDKNVLVYDENNDIVNFNDHFNLYVKVTYNRKTTQFKSFIEYSYYNMDEFLSNHRKMMNYEIKLVHSLMEKKIQSEGENTSPKGIGKTAKRYDQELLDIALDNTINNIKKVIHSTKSKFNGFYLFRESGGNYITLMIEAYIKLLDAPESLIRLLPEAKLLDLFADFIDAKEISDQSVHLLDWIYGDIKESFTSEMTRKGLSKIEIEHVIDLVDIELKSKDLT
jgi:primosomal protein N'